MGGFVFSVLHGDQNHETFGGQLTLSSFALFSRRIIPHEEQVFRQAMQIF
jgi:hypothetical protein